MRLDNGVWTWANIPERYDKELVAKVDNYLVELGDSCWQLPKNKANNYFVGGYAPEIDKTLDLEQELA